MRTAVIFNLFISTFISLSSYAAGAANYVLGEPTKYSFTDCVLKTSSSKLGGEFIGYIGSDAEDKKPALAGKIFFLTKSADSKYHQFEISVASNSSDGWQYIQASDGEVVLSTTSFSANALISPRGSPSGEAVDISSCK